jgi:hypothetical protein
MYNNDQLFPRCVSCRRRSINEGVPIIMLQKEGGPTWEAWFEILFQEGTADEDTIVWPFLPDGTLTWCNNWRQDHGTIPTPPPFTWPVTPPPPP